MKKVREDPRDLAELFFGNATASNNRVNDLLRSSKAKLWRFRTLPYKGTLEGERVEGNMKYVPLEKSDVKIPDWAMERLDWAKANYKVKQVIIGDEIKKPLSKEQEAVVKTAAATRTAILIAVSVVVAAAVGTALLAVVSIAVGLVIISALLLIPFDPQIVIILEDDSAEEWILCAEWLSGS